LLTHRHNGNDRCLSNDITKIAKLQKVRSEQADCRDEQNQDQQRAEAQKPESN
jgi:hypothetical protein